MATPSRQRSMATFRVLNGHTPLCTSSSISPAVSLCGWTEKSFCARGESGTKSANNHFHIANARPHDDNHLPSIIYILVLIGLNKSDGGIMILPIPIGCTLRRLAAKGICAVVQEEFGSILSPRQLGFGTPMGSEAT